MLQWGNGNGSFTRSSVSVCERLFLICVLSRVRCIVQLFCLASISHLALARPALPKWDQRGPSHLDRSRPLPAFPLTASTARYVPHGLYPEHYRTLTPPVRSVVPKVPLLCVCAPPLPSDAIHRAHSAPRPAGRGRQ